MALVCVRVCACVCCVYVRVFICGTYVLVNEDTYVCVSACVCVCECVYVCVCVCLGFVRVHVRMRRSGFLLRPRFVYKTINSKVGPLSLRFAGAAISVACVLAGSVAFVECMLGVIPSSERVRGAAQASSTGAAVTLPSEMGVGIAVSKPQPPGRSGKVAQTLFSIPGLQLPYAAMPAAQRPPKPKGKMSRPQEPLGTVF